MAARETWFLAFCEPCGDVELTDGGAACCNRTGHPGSETREMRVYAGPGLFGAARAFLAAERERIDRAFPRRRENREAKRRLRALVY